jgi:hypothetical protein
VQTQLLRKHNTFALFGIDQEDTCRASHLTSANL